jgi:hypothetical protein
MEHRDSKARKLEDMTIELRHTTGRVLSGGWISIVACENVWFQLLRSGSPGKRAAGPVFRRFEAGAWSSCGGLDHEAANSLSIEGKASPSLSEYRNKEGAVVFLSFWLGAASR